MIINFYTYKKILKYFEKPIPEKGGILGGNGKIITSFSGDIPKQISDKNIYIPNIKYLNSIIEQWQYQDIDFMGIIHSHPINQKELSNDDKKYILKIMMSLPAKKKLFFPLCFGGKEIIIYEAYIEKNLLKLRKDKILILKKETYYYEKKEQK